jgi:hypothetical protein
VAQEFVGRWSGRVTPGHEAEHDSFVRWLRSDEGTSLLRKYSLTEYAMYQRHRELEIVFKSDRQTIIPGILRNKPLWPPFWEFGQPGTSDVPVDKEEVFHWTRD